MKEITLNGAKFQVAANTMDELKNEALGDKNGEMYKFLAKFNANEPDIFILDGFATKENLEQKPKRCHTTLTRTASAFPCKGIEQKAAAHCTMHRVWDERCKGTERIPAEGWRYQ